MNRNKSIQGLRFFGAIAVLVWHTRWLFSQNIVNFLGLIFRGDIANVMFFVLSGFWLTARYSGTNQGNAFVYVLKKLERIYPLWCLSTVYLSLLRIRFGGNPWSIFQTIRHLLLIQAWIPYNNASDELNGPGWFLSVMLFLWILGYLIRPWLFDKKCNKNKLVQYSIATFSGFIILITLSEQIGRSFFIGIYSIGSELAFFFGMIIGKAFELGEVEKIFRNNRVWDGVLLGGFLLLLCVPKGFMCYGVATVYFGILTIYLLSNDKSKLGKFLSRKPFAIGGNYTFEVYLIHMPIVRTIQILFGHFKVDCVLFEFVLIWILVFVSSFLYKWLETKLFKLLRNNQNTAG